MTPEELNARLHCLSLAAQMDTLKQNPGFVRNVKEDAEALLSFAFGANDTHALKIEEAHRASYNYAMKDEVIPLPFSWVRGGGGTLPKDITMYVGNIPVACIVTDFPDSSRVDTCFPKQKSESARVDGPVEYAMKVVCARLQTWASANVDDVRAIIASLKEATDGH